MVYLLDANILITAANTYYGINRVPEFWTWLEHQGGAGYIKMPLEMYEEVLEGRKEGDELLDWVKKDGIRKALLFDEASNADLVRKAVREGYGDSGKCGTISCPPSDCRVSGKSTSVTVRRMPRKGKLLGVALRVEETWGNACSDYWH